MLFVMHYSSLNTPSQSRWHGTIKQAYLNRRFAQGSQMVASNVQSRVAWLQAPSSWASSWPWLDAALESWQGLKKAAGTLSQHGAQGSMAPSTAVLCRWL